MNIAFDAKDLWQTKCIMLAIAYTKKLQISEHIAFKETEISVDITVHNEDNTAMFSDNK